MNKKMEKDDTQKVIHLSDAVEGLLKPTPVKKRLSDAAIKIATEKATIEDAIFQHSAFCQTFFPYRDLGTVHHWEQKQGNIELRIDAGSWFNKDLNAWEVTGVPSGTKSRLILMYLNSYAVQNQSQIIDMGKTMSEFIKEIGLSVQGNTIKEVKEQIRRIATATINLAYVDDRHLTQVKLELVRKIDVWFPKDERQRVLWDSSIELSTDYFESLIKHAIPLDKRAIAALSHNAMALDIYAWLVQRLHRIAPNKPQFVSWQNLKDQFGQGYDRMDDFKRAFRKSLNVAKLEYMSARITEDKNRGFRLENSPTPIPSKFIMLPPTK